MLSSAFVRDARGVQLQCEAYQPELGRLEFGTQHLLVAQQLRRVSLVHHIDPACCHVCEQMAMQLVVQCSVMQCMDW